MGVKDVKDIKWIKKGDHVSFTTKITEKGSVIQNCMGAFSSADHCLNGKVLAIAERSNTFQAQVEIYNTGAKPLTYETEAQSTRVPEWNQSFSVDCLVPHIRSVEFKLSDKDRMCSRTTLLG